MGMDEMVSTHAVVFPGQGSQFEGMADPWVSHPAGKAVMDEASEHMGRDVVAGCRDQAALATTDFVQPALLACGIAAFRVLQDKGLTFAGAAGHSLVEFAALVAAEVMALEDALRVVVIRGNAMQRAGEERPGTMSALIGAGPADAADICDEARGEDILLVANENSSNQVVISGTPAAVERAEAIAGGRKIRAIRLNVAGAFHSPLMEPAVQPVSDALDEIAFSTPKFPIAENVSGELETDPAVIKELLRRHVISPVRWEMCVKSLEGAGASVFIEAGAGSVLTKMAKRIVPDATALAVGSPEEADTAANNV